MPKKLYRCEKDDIKTYVCYVEAESWDQAAEFTDNASPWDEDPGWTDTFDGSSDYRVSEITEKEIERQYHEVQNLTKQTTSP